MYIEHADGSLITVKQFVITAHECLSQHKDAVIKNRNFLRKIPLLPIEVLEPEGTDEDVEVGKYDLLYRLASGTSFGNGSMGVGIDVWLEGELGKLVEVFWEEQRKFAHGLAAQRARFDDTGRRGIACYKLRCCCCRLNALREYLMRPSNISCSVQEGECAPLLV